MSLFFKENNKNSYVGISVIFNVFNIQQVRQVDNRLRKRAKTSP